jgi:hypothetical protein
LNPALKIMAISGFFIDPMRRNLLVLEVSSFVNQGAQCPMDDFSLMVVRRNS